jgi:transcriptional regulator with XRE-family HTH domain
VGDEIVGDGQDSREQTLQDQRTAIGRRVAAHRTRRGWNQQRLADEAGLTRGTISPIETGKGKPKFETLMKIAKALGVPVSKLLEDD